VNSSLGALVKPTGVVGFVVVPRVAVGETVRSEVPIMAVKKAKKAASRLASKKPSTTAKRKFTPKKSKTRAKSAPKSTAIKKSPKKPTKRPLSPKHLPAKKKAAPATSRATPRSPKTFADHARDCDAGTSIWFTVAGGIEHAVIQKQGGDGAVVIVTDAGVTEIVSLGNLFETADEARAARTR
jgi:hypothetical protein